MSKLFSSVPLGPFSLSHRVVMAPLTRTRSEEGDIPGDMMVEYYSQRASAGGFIIAESASVSLRGIAYAGAPGIYADEQITGWKKITDAIHTKGGLTFLQLFHSGRTSHPLLQPNGDDPLAPSAIQAEGYAATRDGPVEVAMPRALETAEIDGIIEEYRSAALRAKSAGFDGVELHGANGYLPDQFLQDGSNQRRDIYGGSVENRARFMLEITEALISVWGNDRVGVRIGPSGRWGSMSDSDPARTFAYIAAQLSELKIAYLHIIEPRIKGDDTFAAGAGPIASSQMRKVFQGLIIAAGGFKHESAEAIINSGDADLVAFGRDFISNPDLPERMRKNLPLNRYDRATFYGGDHKGYTDYPFHAAQVIA